MTGASKRSISFISKEKQIWSILVNVENVSFCEKTDFSIFIVIVKIMFTRG